MVSANERGARFMTLKAAKRFIVMQIETSEIVAPLK